MAPSVPRAYIDTMLFVYKLANPSHRLFRKSDAFFLDVAAKTYIGVTTTFIHAEYRSVVKTLISRSQGSSATQSAVDNDVATLDKFLKKMGIELYNADVVADSAPLTIFYRAEQLIAAANSVKGWNGKWRTIGGADALGVALAELVKANLFATCDQAFKGLSGTSVKPLMVSEVY